MGKMNMKTFCKCLTDPNVDDHVKTHCWALVFSIVALIASIISLIISI